MSNSIKLYSHSIILGFTSFALTAFAGQAIAQDYSLKLTRTADVSVETEYASITKQINKYCNKMQRGNKVNLRMKMAEKKNCQTVLMTNFLKQTNDPIMLAYHNGSTSSSSKTVKFVENDENIKRN